MFVNKHFIILGEDILKNKLSCNAKPSIYYFYVMTKILLDFHIRVSVLLKSSHDQIRNHLIYTCEYIKWLRIWSWELLRNHLIYTCEYINILKTVFKRLEMIEKEINNKNFMQLLLQTSPTPDFQYPVSSFLLLQNVRQQYQTCLVFTFKKGPEFDIIV